MTSGPGGGDVRGGRLARPGPDPRRRRGAASRRCGTPGTRRWASSTTSTTSPTARRTRGRTRSPRRSARRPRRSGIRIVLLLTAYARGGFGRPPDPGQRRFCDATVEAYLDRARRPAAVGGRPAARHRRRRAALRPRRAGATGSSAIAEHCADHGLSLHLHADEQPREIAESPRRDRPAPVELLERAGALGPARRSSTARTATTPRSPCSRSAARRCAPARRRRRTSATATCRRRG